LSADWQVSLATLLGNFAVQLAALLRAELHSSALAPLEGEHISAT
jgi:hypothetical protein